MSEKTNINELNNFLKDCNDKQLFLSKLFNKLKKISDELNNIKNEKSLIKEKLLQLKNQNKEFIKN